VGGSGGEGDGVGGVVKTPRRKKGAGWRKKERMCTNEGVGGPEMMGGKRGGGGMGTGLRSDDKGCDWNTLSSRGGRGREYLGDMGICSSCINNRKGALS